MTDRHGAGVARADQPNEREKQGDDDRKTGDKQQCRRERVVDAQRWREFLVGRRQERRGATRERGDDASPPFAHVPISSVQNQR